MFTGLFISFIKATTTTSPLVTPPPLSSPLFRRPRAARRASIPLRTTIAESEKLATLEVKYRTSRTNFIHRIA